MASLLSSMAPSTDCSAPTSCGGVRSYSAPRGTGLSATLTATSSGLAALEHSFYPRPPTKRTSERPQPGTLRQPERPDGPLDPAVPTGGAGAGARASGRGVDTLASACAHRCGHLWGQAAQRRISRVQG